MVNQKNDEQINPWPSPFLHDIAVLTHMLPGPFLACHHTVHTILHFPSYCLVRSFVLSSDKVVLRWCPWRQNGSQVFLRVERFVGQCSLVFGQRRHQRRRKRWMWQMWVCHPNCRGKSNCLRKLPLLGWPKYCKEASCLKPSRTWLLHSGESSLFRRCYIQDWTTECYESVALWVSRLRSRLVSKECCFDLIDQCRWIPVETPWWLAGRALVQCHSGTPCSKLNS